VATISCRSSTVPEIEPRWETFGPPELHVICRPIADQIGLDAVQLAHELKKISHDVKQFDKVNLSAINPEGDAKAVDQFHFLIQGLHNNATALPDGVIPEWILEARDTLLSKHDYLYGKTGAQIEALLGLPDSNSKHELAYHPPSGQPTSPRIFSKHAVLSSLLVSYIRLTGDKDPKMSRDKHVSMFIVKGGFGEFIEAIAPMVGLEPQVVRSLVYYYDENHDQFTSTGRLKKPIESDH
jgi:hypothetical protein